MRAWKIILTLLLLLGLCALPIHADDENFGEADEFETTEQENFGEIEEFDTTLPTESGSTTQQGQEQTTPPAANDGESQSETTKGESRLPPVREQVWALPIPVIWATIALVGIAGTVLAVLFLIKYFKEDQ